MNIYLVIFITLIAALLTSFAQLLFKMGVPKKMGSMVHVFRLVRNRKVLCGGALYLLSLIVYLYALGNADLSIIYPTFASTFIFVALLSAFVLKEKVGGLRVLGVSLVFLGIIMIAYTV